MLYLRGGHWNDEEETRKKKMRKMRKKGSGKGERY